MLSKREACWGALGIVGTTYAVAAVCWFMAHLTFALSSLVSPESVIEAARTLQKIVTDL